MAAIQDGARIRLGITIGDPAGIGPEVISRALRELPAEGLEFHVYGDQDAIDRAGGLASGIIRHAFASAAVAPGAPDPAAAPGVEDAIRSAARACLDRKLDALVTGPISKQVMAEGGFLFPGHTELLEAVSAERSSATGPAVMCLVGGALRVALATIHCPLREVPARLSTAGLRATLRILDRDLRRLFALPAPSIAVCGLNPHAGEGGRIGDEEARVIAPAIRAAQADGIDARGPLPADSLFWRAAAGEFDCVLGMYHDQALAPLKVHAFGKAVNVTLGLPLIRTSVDHGTGFDIAGLGRADPGSLHEALALARRLVSAERSAAASAASARSRE